MTPPASNEPHRAYSERLARAKAALAKLDATSARFANLRTLAFLGAGVLAAMVLLGKLPRVHWALAGAAAAAYVLLAVLHQRVFRQEARGRYLVTLNERGLARLAGRWHAFSETGERFLSPAHLYAADLDVFGQGSAFQLLNETATRAGEERLASWLSGPAPLDEIRARQGAVQELAPRVDFRQELCVEAHEAAKDKADPRLFVEWAERPSPLEGIRWARPVAVALPFVTLALFVLGREGLVPRPLWWASLLVQLGVVGLTRRALQTMESAMSAGERGFVRYAPLFARLEQERFEHPLLVRLRSGLEPRAGASISSHLARFSWRYSFVEFKRHQFHPVIHLFTLWDVHALFAMERWRREHGAHVRGWFEALAEVEALGCLAGLAHDRPGFTYPELLESGPRVEGEAIGHPLLDAPVLNDVALPGPSHALLVTGSNMSGKTTLVRALGLNVVLALAGAPVLARSLRLSSLQVLTSMRVKDSLERGVSYFYAEVQRLKAVLDGATAAKGQALFLLDEILLGTNTRERQIASRVVLELLLATGACGAVTTHDLSLATLAEAPGLHVRNIHFRDQLVNGEMSFDYRVREGVVDTTNALRVMRAAGIPVGGLSEASLDNPEMPREKRK